MKLKLLFITIALILSSFCANAQNSVYWRDTNSTGSWQYGTGCASWDNDGNWYYPPASGSGNRQRPDCAGTFNVIYFANNNNPNMDLNSGPDYSANQIQFTNATPDRFIGSSSGKGIYFQNNGSNCKIENNVAVTTHTFNVDIFVNSGGNNMEINPVYGFLYFNNTITNNSNNPINIYGEQQVTFDGNITGNPGVTINSTATVVYSGTSKTYTGLTTINSGTKLKISSNQTLRDIALNGGTLEIVAGATLTITGTYTSTSGTIDNKGTIKFAGGSVTFPGNATVNNGTANTLVGFEAASSGIVTLNTLLRVTNSITVSSGTLLLGGNDLHLNNATLNIGTGGTFDNGGENQIISDAGSPLINISGTFITRDKDGFVGDTTVIPSINPTLNAGSTVEYGLNGNQDVQGLTAPTYSNVTFSGSGTKTLISGNNVTGTVTIKDAAIFNSTSFTFGGAGTNLTMTDTSRLIVSGARPVPDMEGTYTLSGGTIEFAGNSNSHTARSPIITNYNNIVISGPNVNGSAGNYTLRNGATFTVNTGGVFTVSDQRIIAAGASATININGSFVTKDADGFYGSTLTSISPTNTILNLGSASTIEYAGANQSITTVPANTAYANLTVSGTGTKTIPTELFLGNNLSVNASTLLIESNKTLIVTNNVVVNPAATMTLETNTFNQSASLVQINDAAINSGTVIYRRNSTGGEKDYTYWSTPVAGQTLLAVSPFTKLDKFFSFDSVANDWLQANPSTEMIIGKGYIIRGIPPPPFPALPPGFTTASFIGTPNNGIHKISGVVADKPYLLGNPYPCALNAEKFLNSNSGVLDGTLYFWTHYTAIQDRNLIVGNDQFGNPKVGTGILAYTSDDYASYNTVGGVAAGDGVIPNGRIGAGQGFFASSNATIFGINEIVFNNSMRLSSDAIPTVLNNSQFFKTRNPKTKTTVFEKHRIWLNLTNTQGVFKQTLVGYITDATNQYDSRFDGISFDGNQFVDFYSVNQEKNLVIQGRALPFDENDEVPLGFRTTISGDFTIKIDQADGVLTNQTVYIEDKLTNSIFDLRSGSFTFNTAAGTFNDRFVLRYTNKTLETKDLETLEKQVLVSNKNKQIKINSKTETIDKVAVYDLLGRQLFKKDKVNNNELAIPNLVSNQQTLLVKVILQNGQTVTKKIMY
ncbi:T9SS sorting signal type C domain-containing protein [Flavobacterium sp.]|jgi:hypothetical protein|uniref:T9SS sorting signal type C domain-containing protein n=1 Tax=Flavobacterium sp. TaxID=239 RepID=UPI0037BF9BED